MIGACGADEIERFRASVTRLLGLQFDDAQLGFVTEVLRRRLQATSLGAAAYLRTLEPAASADELQTLISELTVAETYFFRHFEQYRAFAEVALPDRLRVAQGVGGRVRIVTAGCATGEEPYSLAMMTREIAADPVRSVSISALDINPALIERARRGRFSRWVLRETPDDVRDRWFEADGKEFVLNDVIRRSVSFEVCNLREERPDLWAPESFDIVFCRNVLMYFAPAVALAAINRFARALRPGGYLFLGHAETLRGVSTDFHLRHTHGSFYYQRRERLGAPPIAESLAAAIARDAPPSDPIEGTTSWVDAIRCASQRIEALAGPMPSRAPGRSPQTAGAAAAVTAPAWDVGLTLELLREERYTDALQLLARSEREGSLGVEALLLRAILLTHSGQLRDAERTCKQLLDADDLNAGAHYLLALCREGAGDAAAAVYHDQVALYLDPGFAMAHLHMGLLARRNGDRAVARRELEQAIVLLKREDPSRLLLFGGGFSRDALTALCRAELAVDRGAA
jgi:chemotaxis protein methyltransferase CheR